MTPRKRTKIVTLHENTGKMYRGVAAVLGVSLATVNHVIILKQNNGTSSPKLKGKCGRRKETTSRDDACLDKVKKISAKRATH